MDKVTLWIIGLTVVVLGSVLFFGSRSASDMERLSDSFTGDDATIVAEGAVHWHPKLSIVIGGESRSIPNDVGIGPAYATHPFYDTMMGMTDVHTHEEGDGTLHWEVMKGPVKKGHARLKAFFSIWGEPFDREHILDKTNGEEGMVSMTVNGQPNTEFEQYVVKDGDQIEIRYE